MHREVSFMISLRRSVPVPNGLEVLLAPLVAEFEHCVLDFAADSMPFSGAGSVWSAPAETAWFIIVCALLAADLDEGSLAGLVTDDAPVAAGKICLPGDLHLAATTVAASAIALFFELVHGDALWPPSYSMMNWPLSISSLCTLSGSTPNFSLIIFRATDSALRNRRSSRRSGRSVVQVDLVALCHLVEGHRVAALYDTPIFMFGSALSTHFASCFGYQQGSAVEGPAV
jgi:hypothetical protein